MKLRMNLKAICICAMMSLASFSCHGQDLLASQAPVDKRMKAVDTLSLRRLIVKENMENPSADLYKGWDNKYAHRATELPESYRIDLRGFCMPTPSRVVTSNFGYRARWGRQNKGLDIKV